MATSTKQQTIQFAIGSFADEDTTQAYKHIRVEEVPETPKNIKQVMENPNVGHSHYADIGDKPVTYEGVQEDSLKIRYTFRSNAVAGEIDFVRAAFESAGCTISTVATAESLSSNLGSGDFSTTSNLLSAGEGAVIGVDGSTYIPTLVSSISGTGPYVCSTAFDPATTASYINKSVTITPSVGDVDSAKMLSFKHGTNISASSNQEHWVSKHCGLASLGDITFTPQGKVVFDFGFHVTDVDDLDEAFSTETFVDSEKFPILGGSNMEVAFCNSSTAGSWSTLTNSAANKINLIEATAHLGIGSIPIPGAGNSSVNSCQGFFGKYLEPATITIKALFDKDYWDDIEDGTFQEYYFHIVQKSTSATVPCLGLFMPRVYQYENPTLIAEMDSYYMMELKLKCTSAEFDTSVGNDSLTMAPWALCYNLLA